MGSIDLYSDFNEEFDAQQGDLEQDDDGNRANNTNGSDQENGNINGSDQEGKQEVDAGIKVKKPKRKLVTLNAEKLKGPRGIVAIDDFFQNVKLKGKGHEKEDLNEVMKRLEHWSHRMFPKYHFDDSLTKIERLGRKKEISLHMTRYRLGQLTKDDENQVLSDNDNDNEMEDTLAHELPVDEFEDMLNQQIALSTTTNRINNTTSNNESSVGQLNMSQISSSTQIHRPVSQSIIPKDTSSSSSQDIFSQLKNSTQPQNQLTDEQKARIEENRKRAMEIRAAKMKELEAKKLKEAEEKKSKEAEVPERTINIEIDDDFC